MLNLFFKWFTCCFFAVVILSDVCTAFERHSYSYYLNSGLSIPISPTDFSKHWDISPNFGFGIGYPLAPSYSIVCSFNYNRFPYDRSGGAEGADITLLSISACFKANFQKRAGFYLSAGFGYFRLTSDDYIEYHPWAQRAGDLIYESDLALFIGPGFEKEISKRLSVFAELNEVICFSSPQSTEYMPIKIGLIIR